MNNGCGQLGAIQTQGTCWFYSILNGFILSTNGQKILYEKMKEFYNSLSAAEKAHFTDDLNAPCPMKDFIKTKKLYFWKFIDQYLCFMSGPRAKSLQLGKSVNMLGGMSLVGTLARGHAGAMGAKPHEEIVKILSHVGFKEKSSLFKSHKDFLVVDFADSEKAGKLSFDRRSKPKFIIVKKAGDNYMESSTPGFITKDPDYSLMCSSIVIGNSRAKSNEMHKYHAVAGYVCNGNGYIYDSNQRKIFKCDYWNWPELKKTLDNNVGDFYSFFKGGKINYYSIAFHILARKDYVKNIGPSCLMKYRVKTPTVYGVNFASPNLGRRINDPKHFGWLKPAERVALKRKWARTEHVNYQYLNRAALNAIVTKAKSVANAYANRNALVKAGYAIRYDNSNYFNNRVNAKFKAPSPAPQPSPARLTFAEAKARLNQFSGSTKAVRKHQYSLVWKGVPLAQRRVLMHWRDTGNWLANNAFENKGKPPIRRKSVAKPSSPKSASPETKRKNQLVANFEKYWSALSSENRKFLRNWNSTKFQSPSRKGPSPSPVKNTSVLNAAKRNVNGLKTAKARKEYRKQRAVNMNQDNWMALTRYIETKNYEARERRAQLKSARA